MGSDEGGREGGDEGGVSKDGASTDMPRDASDGRVSGLVFSFCRPNPSALDLFCLVSGLSYLRQMSNATEQPVSGT